MARQAAGVPLHRAMAGWAAQSHTASGISPRPLDARCHPCPGTLRCRREYRCAGGRRGGQMIARIWRGWAPLATADDYQRHYETEVSRHLRAVSGFRGARLLRRDDGPEVMFTSITFFTSLDAIRGFAGDDFELAVVEETARQALSRWDERVSHHQVVADLE